MLSFQRLDVYQRAIEFLALVYDVVGELPRGRYAQGIHLLEGVVAMLTKMF